MTLLRKLMLGMVLSAGFAFHVPAAEPEAAGTEDAAAPGETREPEAASEEAADSEGDGAPATEEARVAVSDDTFIPSEQISEDLSVSFPVDI